MGTFKTKYWTLWILGQKAAGAADNDYIPEAEANKVIANTKTLGGGEETTITVEAPKKGTYDFHLFIPRACCINER